MNRSAAVLLVTSLAGLLSACGQGAPLGDGKRGAAKAAFTAMRPANDSSTGSAWDPLSGAGQPIDVGVSTTVKGEASGSAQVKLDVSVDQLAGANDVAVRKDITYADFSDDGKTFYNGNLKVDLLVSTTSNSASVKLRAKGQVTLSGEISDVLDIDTTLEVATNAWSSGSASASVKLNGFITTRSGRYDYRDEAISIDVKGDLPADSAANP